jgi:flagellar hook-length control protein FliK
MNVDGANSISILPGKSIAEADPQSFAQNSDTKDDFTSALKSQKGLLGETKEQAETPVQTQAQAVDNTKITTESPKTLDDQKELVALFEKYLPDAYTVSAENKGASVELAPQAQIDTTETKPTFDTEPALQGLSDALEANTNATSAADNLAPQDLSGALALTGLNFVKPAPEEAKLIPTAGEDMTTDDFLSKEAAFRMPMQGSKAFNMASMENAEATKQASSDKQSFSASLESAMPTAATDVPANKLVENRAEVPALTKPMSHPGWSKDLGEQIIWMKNKELSAAEIRMNPAHLGPISVRIDVNQEHQTTIMFAAQHAETRDAIEASIPKLKEMLSNTQQFNSVNVNISQHPSSDQGRSQSRPFRPMPENYGQGDNGADLMGSEVGQTVVGKGLLSLYA